MGISEFAVINCSTLDSLFRGKPVGEILVFEKVHCVGCGESIDIKIQKTSGGYGFLNGVISDPSEGRLLAKCSRCTACKEANGI
jgi:hypothetical protein